MLDTVLDTALLDTVLETALDTVLAIVVLDDIESMALLDVDTVTDKYPGGAIDDDMLLLGTIGINDVAVVNAEVL